MYLRVFCIPIFGCYFFPSFIMDHPLEYEQLFKPHTSARGMTKNNSGVIIYPLPGDLNFEPKSTGNLPDAPWFIVSVFFLHLWFLLDSSIKTSLVDLLPDVPPLRWSPSVQVRISPAVTIIIIILKPLCEQVNSEG